ncbi:MSC_0620 family F1-like ATPase-associated subunit [Mycoplasma struthionis]|uniref:Uncharacterized protein n=1 Tax=Mycoplasma struthionis TaxID=538220 RepID=A0A502MIY3_9MOLU|nr:hypothetical protein [Mycoplasma struthionis]TPI02276.1 hypothetical protein FJM01_01250 [Mycoplasma struthionis]
MKLKKWLLLGTVLPVSMAPLITLSADPEPASNGATSNASNGATNTNKPTNPFAPNANAEPEKPKVVDPQFGTFKKVTEDKIKEKLKELVNNKIAQLKAKSSKLIDPAETKITTESLYESLYLAQVAKYLETNKDKIINDKYKDYGFEIVYPKILSNDRSLESTTITYNGKDYENAVVGKTDKTDYRDFIQGEGNKKEVKEENVVNAVNADDLQSKTEKYFSDLDSKFDEIFANKEDFPELNTAVRFVKDENNDTNIGLTIPDKYTSWDQFLKEKISSRFKAFDLEENSQDNKKETPDIQEPNPTPRLIPGQADPTPPSSVNAATENIGRLSPFLKFNFYDQANNRDGLVQSFKQAVQSEPDKASEKYFYFNNPINTRFDYKVDNLDLTKDGIEANVILTDKLDETKKITYKRVISIWSDVEFARAHQVGIEIIQKLYKEFYDALGIGENIDFSKMSHRIVAEAVFNMILESVKIINSQEYSNYFINLTNNFKSQEPAALETNSYNKNLVEAFLGLHKNAIINGRSYWSYLADAYKQVYDIYIKYVKKELNESIAKNFALAYPEDSQNRLHMLDVALKKFR